MLRPLRGLVTFNLVPNFKVRCAAVMAFGFMRSPLAVLFPGNEYQDATPQACLAKAKFVYENKMSKPAMINNTIRIKNLLNMSALNGFQLRQERVKIIFYAARQDTLDCRMIQSSMIGWVRSRRAVR